MQPSSAGRELRRFAVIMGMSLLAIAGILALQPGSVDLSGFARMRPHAPDLAALGATPATVQLHVVSVLVALVLGPVQFALPKGTRLHRRIGWAWFVAMLLAALSSAFIRDINEGGFSAIHIFTAWTLVSLPLAVWTARRGHIRAHRGTMVGLYVGLVIAGLLSIAPGRLTWALFFG